MSKYILTIKAPGNLLQTPFEIEHDITIDGINLIMHIDDVEKCLKGQHIEDACMILREKMRK